MYNIMKYAVPFSLLAGVLALSSSAEAKPSVRSPNGRVQSAGAMDSDHNGRVSRAEIRAFYRLQAKANIQRLDKNGDGWLSQRELQKAPNSYRSLLPSKRQPRAKARSDGRRMSTLGVSVKQVYQVELREADRRFTDLDRNRDGVLSRQEVLSAKARTQKGDSKKYARR